MILFLKTHPNLIRLILTVGLAIALSGCACEPLGLFQNGRPILEPEKYFSGRTHSWGLFETRSGVPRELFTTETTGHLEDGVLHFEQDLFFGNGKKQHRSWLVQRIDANHYTVTGTGIVGIGHGVTSGNAFHLVFTLDAIPGNPLGHLRMSQWMFLQSDGVTLINRDTLTKAGIIVQEITECFNKVH